jgi:6-phosphogluconolactonase
MTDWQQLIGLYDDRRDIVVPGDKEQTLKFCAEQFTAIAIKSIGSHGRFNVALSGGGTPKAIFQLVTSPPYSTKIEWSKVFLFWSDERAVPADHPDSNYRMAMEAGFASVPIPKNQIFRMPADAEDIEEAAKVYEKILSEHLPHGTFDLTMLGMGEDGHTASLFPKTHGLHPIPRQVIANYVPTMDCWRMTLTFECINASSHIAIYVIGKSKGAMLKRALAGPYTPDEIPIQRVGTRSRQALWIADSAAAAELQRP